jgi:hypothetical protein
MTAEQIVQIQLYSYNNRDIESFMNCFAADIRLYSFYDNKVLIEGSEAYRKMFTEIFACSPNLQAKLLNRMAYNNVVIDHECIIGRMGATEPVEMVMIYEVAENKIKKATLIRK